MRIVVTTTLNNNLFHAKLVPLIRARPDIQLVVVSDREGPAYERVKWVYPKGKQLLLGRLLPRLVLLQREVFRGDTRLVMAYSLVPHGFFAVMVAKLRRRPVFLHFIAGPAELRFAHDIRVTDNRLIEATRWPGFWEKVALRFSLAADRIFVPGPETAQALEEEGIPAARISVLHSTIDPEKYATPDPNTERDIDIVVCAQLRERKRPLFTLDIISQLVQKYPALRIVWLGDGGMKDEFDQYVLDLNLQENLQRLHTDDVGDFFKRSKLFLLCSVNEGLSLASLEAMACGVVPVVARCGDMASVVLQDTTGFVLEQNATADDYVATISAVLEDVDTWRRLSSAATTEVYQHHSFPCAQQKWRAELEKYCD